MQAAFRFFAYRRIMNPIDAFSWLTSEHGLMALLAQNWVLGTFIICAVVFVETGLVIMPFLPGDSLLFAAGAFLGLAGVSPWLPLLAVTLAAIAGDALNYSIGNSPLSQRILARKLVKPAHMEKAAGYFARFGAQTIIVARFIPIVRTVAPFCAGLARMPRRTFFAYNVVGAALWVGVMMLAGHFLGAIPWVKQNLHWVSLIIIVLSVGPLAIHALARWRNRQGA
ncbi:DedA protein [plant metagenome]|uniref:DedA protein n=1 Tax=plant metagenome TaxID=1297885 RepID=A0A484QYE9_9ZZZZ